MNSTQDVRPYDVLPSLYADMCAMVATTPVSQPIDGVLKVLREYFAVANNKAKVYVVAVGHLHEGDRKRHIDLVRQGIMTVNASMFAPRVIAAESKEFQNVLMSTYERLLAKA